MKERSIRKALHLTLSVHCKPLLQTFVVTFIVTLVVPLFSVYAAAETPARPVVIIPGILGSVLSSKSDGQVIWGDRLSLTRLSKLEIPSGPRDPFESEQLNPVGIIASIQVLGPWKIKQYDGLRSVFEQMNYVPGVNYFEFPYDWRRSNLVNAGIFRQWVTSNERLRDKEFDIVAHSMGGIIADIYTKIYDEKRQVRRLVTLGTPYLGSANAVLTPFSGWGAIANTMAGGIAEIRRVVLSFPSFYELLPTYSNCCILGLPSDQGRKPFNILSPTAWFAINWQLPAEMTSDTWKGKISAVLSDAEKVSQLIALPPPDHLRGATFRIAGDLIETPGQFYVDRSTGNIARWNSFLGDGTVLVRSASRDDLGSAFVSFTAHQTIFDDKAVGTQLKRIFDPAYAGPRYYGTNIYVARTSEGDVVRVRSIDTSVVPAVVTGDQEFSVMTAITVEAGQPVELLKIAVKVDDGLTSQPLSTEISTTEDSFDSRRAIWKSVGQIRSEVGPVRLVVSVPGLGDIEDYVVVLTRAPK